MSGSTIARLRTIARISRASMQSGPWPRAAQHVAGQTVASRMQHDFVLPADHDDLEPSLDRARRRVSFGRGGIISSFASSELELRAREFCPNDELDDDDDDELDCVSPPSGIPPD